MATTTVQFEFSIGDRVRLPDGERGVISGLLATRDGNQYRIRIGFNSEFRQESDVKADDTQ